MFKNNKAAILEFLEGKDWTHLDQIALKTDLPVTKALTILYKLYKEKIVEKDDNRNFRIIPKPKEEEPELPKVIPLPQQKSKKEEKEQTGNSEGLNAQINDMRTKLDIALGVKDKKEKKARLKRFNLSKVKRFNKNNNRSVIFLGNDQSISLIKGEYFDAYKILKVNKNYYKAGAIYTWLWGKKQPVYLVPEWSIEPVTANELTPINAPDLYKDAIAKGTMIDPQLATIQAAKMIEMDKEESQAKKKGGFMMWIGIAVAGIIIVWLFMGGQK